MARDEGEKIVIKKNSITAGFEQSEPCAGGCRNPISAATSALPCYIQANHPTAALER